jgi:hypothetical protein
MKGDYKYYAYATVILGEPIFRQEICYFQERRRQVGDQVIHERAADPLRPDANGVFVLNCKSPNFSKMVSAIEEKAKVENAKNAEHPRIVGPADSYEDVLVKAIAARPKTDAETAATLQEEVSRLREENARLVAKASKPGRKPSADAEPA